MMKPLLMFIVCICGSAALAGVGLVEFSCDGLVAFEGARSVKTAGIRGAASSIVLEAGAWRVDAKAFEVVSGEVLRLGTLTGTNGQPIHETKPSGKSGKLRVTAVEKAEWRLWGEDSWRKGSAETTLPPGVYRLEWQENETVQGRLLALDEDQQLPLAIPHTPLVLIESKTESEMLVGPKREGPPRLGDVVVLKNERSEVVSWHKLQKPVEHIFHSAASVVPLVTFNPPVRKRAIELLMKRLGISDPVGYIESQSHALMVAEGPANPDTDEEIKDAAFWLFKSANNGNAWAQFMLGSLYSHGEGVQRDIRTASHWLKLAASQGITQAMNLLQQLDAKSDDNQTRSRLEELRSKRDEQFKRRGM